MSCRPRDIDELIQSTGTQDGRIRSIFGKGVQLIKEQDAGSSSSGLVKHISPNSQNSPVDLWHQDPNVHFLRAEEEVESVFTIR